ncbi:hypothetical protein BH09BAC1_BH09BAC1_29930 [soil metagenome]
MKKTIQYGAILLLMFASLSTFAQGKNDSDNIPHEKIKTLKIAYLTSKLNFTAEEAQAFWPLYNEYQDKKLAINQKRMNMGKAMKNDVEQFTDAELNKMLDEYIALRQQESNLEAEYLQKFRKVLPVKKIVLLQKAEREFKMEVLQEYKKRCDAPIPGNSK